MELQFGSTARSVSSSQDIMSIAEPDTEELVREIALLELEVMYLEQYLLSLYRRAFDHQVLTLSSSSVRNSDSKVIQHDSTLRASSRKEGTKHLSFRETMNQNSTIKLVPQDDDQCSSALFSQRATCSAWMSSSNESLATAAYSCHSPLLSFHKEEKNHASRAISLAEYLGANIDDHVPETPNRLSEQMVRCMSVMLCKLADPPMVCHGPPSSPVSLPSSVSVLSPIQQKNSPIHKHQAFDSWLINAFQAKGLTELSGAHTDSCIVEVPSISRDPWRLRGVEDMLQNYKSVLGRLKMVDPMKMKHEEKLAFWVNIHNALVMHAYVECGIPQDNRSKASLLVKASCAIGTCVVNAAIIRGSILCCRTHCPRQGLQSLFHSRFKNKVGDRWHGYAIEQQEPLLHFALCSGSYSDPPVRVYSPKRVFQQLEAAKEEYIQATARICKEEKIIVPKIVDLYAKEMALSTQALVDMVHHHLSGNFPKSRSSSKVFEWQPYNFNFRYLLSREVAW
ncbi:uncharacterized protein LOC122001319 [Zingiber officinale]|uniref:uncharacterized protein LOC122001319 n=1 Tax=Zingiber officinale TaxID=94328 RepID=UPI001C4C67FB|nr:uncharacterized protein LOC122001319 [Zingiber officinale]XP_042411936.1 uncharacterized protein LOC122001319 [Zingiber officinale]